jgi:transposase
MIDHRAAVANKPRGVARVDDRRVLNGIFWTLRTGSPWRDLPERYGPYTTAYNRYNPGPRRVSGCASFDAGVPVWAHAFEQACAKGEIDHRLTKPKHPWTNGQSLPDEGRGRADEPDPQGRHRQALLLRNPRRAAEPHLEHFVQAYNYARRFKTLKGLTSRQIHPQPNPSNAGD